jgi:DNA-binding HxlR family transcriptional regulator
LSSTVVEYLVIDVALGLAPMTAKRDYDQFCGLAAGLNIVGERWTLLIIRELLLGPARFSELIDNLVGIGPNLLTDRLRTLEMYDIIESAPVPGDLRGKRYRLTDLGMGLREPVLLLARWGMPFLCLQDPSGLVRSDWGFLAVQAMVRPDLVPDVRETYLFNVGDRSFTIEVDHRTVRFSRTSTGTPELTITSDAETFIRIGARMLNPFEALVNGSITIDGEMEVVQRCITMLGLGDPLQQRGRGAAQPFENPVGMTVER